MARYIKCDSDRFVNVDIIETFECGWYANKWAIFMYFNNHEDRYVISPFRSYEDACKALNKIMCSCAYEAICQVKGCDMIKDSDYRKE